MLSLEAVYNLRGIWMMVIMRMMIMITNMFNVLEVEKPNRSLGSQTAQAEKDIFHNNQDHLKSYDYDDCHDEYDDNDDCHDATGCTPL